MLELEQRKQLKKGVLIAIDGIDGSGKTTQTMILFERLRKNGYPVVHLHEPTEGVWGQKIKDLATNGRHRVTAETEFDFFFQDRLEDVEKNILPTLKKKKIVIMDRYYFSNVAYQGARGLDPTYIEKRNKEIAPEPDIFFLLDLTSKAALRRIRNKRKATPSYFERERYLENVRQIFLKQFKNRPNVIIIDGNETRSPNTIADEIWRMLEPILKEVEET